MVRTRFSHKLQVLRERKDYTQTQVARYLGCSQQTISSWESGDIIPSLSSVEQLAQLFKVNLYDLIDEYTVYERSQIYQTKEDFFESFFTSKSFLDYYPNLNYQQLLAFSKIIQAHVEFLAKNIKTDEQ